MSVVISLGWNCDPATQSKNLGIRSSREQGYRTCPFDLMISNFPGVCECLETDFAEFCDPDMLEIMPCGNIRHTKYRFIFNHESRTNYEALRHEMWSSPDHFTKNNFYNFMERYQARIDNFREYIQNKNVIFVIQRCGGDAKEIPDIITRKYPNLRFKCVCITNPQTHFSANEKADIERMGCADRMDRFSNPGAMKDTGKCLYIEDYSELPSLVRSFVW
jgi:hypothetical protein